MYGKGQHILLVEAEPVLAEVTAFRLELLGYSVSVAPSAETARPAILEHRPSLVMVDLELPDADAVAFIEQLASDEKTSSTPIIALSTDADLERVQTVYAAGARDFLVVPYHPEVLEDKVARQMVRASELKDDRAQPAAEML